MEPLPDPLSDVFAALNVRTTALCGFEATGSWKLWFPVRDHIKIGVVLSGSYWLAADGGAPVELRAGDCFLLAARDTFVLATDWAAPAADGEQLFGDPSSATPPRARSVLPSSASPGCRPPATAMIRSRRYRLTGWTGSPSNSGPRRTRKFPRRHEMVRRPAASYRRQGGANGAPGGRRTMQYTQLGATGIFVSRIALGTMTFGGGTTPPGRSWARWTARRPTSSSVWRSTAASTLIDTADFYANGESEEILGRALGSRRRDGVLATKLFARMGPGPNQTGLSRLWVTQALEDSLRRLGTDHIDLYQIHSFDPLTPVEETLGALDDAVRAGKIRYLGASNLAAWQMMKYLGAADLRGLNRFVSQQVYYSLAGRDVEREIMPMAVDQRLGTLVWSPLAGGFLSGKIGRTGTTDETARSTQFSYPPVRNTGCP
ncbi:aldo/keto reductase [Streptomyces sp. SID13031]|uniref:aldo/keto reductase n=1 Tax=Streptomyces sp. SID13031 TaxID=2706046 RepID=UPI0013C8E7D4|nr:aldo/keto reductase [Streptomyces sp. SID13031]NEA31417.1 hypothetical protein [Streptomyces sp. SID13031]